MIYYCYIGDYDDSFSIIDTDDRRSTSRIYNNTAMYGFAEKYDMQGLKKTAKSKFDDVLSQFSPFSPLKAPPDVLESKINRVANVISLVYSSTPESDRGLRDSILDFVQQYWKELSAVPDFNATIAQTPQFAVEIIGRKPLEVAKPPCSGKCHRCSSTEKWKTDHVTCGCGWGERC